MRCDALFVPGEGETLVVSFTSFGNHGGPPREGAFEWRHLLEPFSCHKLFLIDAQQHWYHGPVLGFSHSMVQTAAEIRRIAEENGTRRIVTLGTSMGAHAAMLIGAHIGADRALSFAPQVNLTSEFMASIGDERWVVKISEMNAIGYEALDLGKEDLSGTRISLFYDGHEDLDRAHAMCLANTPGTDLVDVGYGGHSMAYEMAKRGEVTRLIREALTPSPAGARRPQEAQAETAGRGAGVPTAAQISPRSRAKRLGFLRLGRHGRVRKRVLESNLFDREWYLKRYPDVASTAMDPLDHYLAHGGAEGRSAGPEFSASQYLASYPDVAASGTHPLLHYLTHGEAEGRARFRDPFSSINDFFLEPYPGRPKILFIGWPESSHTHSWIDLLANERFNVRLFCLPSREPPPDWQVRCYVTAPNLPFMDSAWRQTGFPTVPLSHADRKPVANMEDALAEVIRAWQPDIIHSLGLDPASYFYYRARQQHGLQRFGRWVAQARGGPDLALQWYSPEFQPRIKEVLSDCDHFIADNEQNYEMAVRVGLSPTKVTDPGVGVVSGAGGLDVDELRSRWTLLPSQRERVIVWPKAYEIYTAKAMPVFEAILKVWPRIEPCRIEMLWMDHPEVRIWYEKLFPPELKAHCRAHSRLSREETLAHMVKARVMMAPSLSDGIPNSMMEAMALGAAPLVSPLDTITHVVREPDNVLFARNLYPDEIAEQLVRMMSDDGLVDRMAVNNVERVREMADRNRVRERVTAFYEEVAAPKRMAHRGTTGSAPRWRGFRSFFREQWGG